MDQRSMGRGCVEVDHKRCEAEQLGTGEQRPLNQQRSLMKMLNPFTTIQFEGEKKHQMRFKNIKTHSRYVKMWASTPGCAEGPRLAALGWT